MVVARVTENDPAALSLLGMIHLRAAVAAARHQDRPTATGLLDRAEELADDLGSDENYWQTGFGPTNVVLHRLSVELDLDNVSYVVEHGQINVDHMPQERSVSHRIDFARALSLAGQGERRSRSCARLSARRRSSYATIPGYERRCGT